MKSRHQIALEMYRPKYPFLFQTDSYMHTFWKQLPPNTEALYSYFGPRGGKYNHCVFFGLQEDLVNLSGPVLSEEMLDFGLPVLNEHFFGVPDVVNEKGFRSLVKKHNGHLPVSIKALPEGIIVPNDTPFFTVESTDPEFKWVQTMVETKLSHNWATSTAATKGWYDAREMRKHMIETAGTDAGWEFKIHDFGQRGSSSDESASRIGAAYLLNSRGTDTLLSLPWLMAYYNTEKVWGFSIPAMCHMTVTSWGKPHEIDAYRNALKQFPQGFLACVSDSYDYLNAVKTIWCNELKQDVLDRDGVLVIRPDSGKDPGRLVCESLKALGDAFGYTRTEQGYQLLNPKVRLIWGDGINSDTREWIIQEMRRAGWAVDNIAFGEGGERHQKIHRDVMKCAYKCSAALQDGSWVDVFKDPVTDPGKMSRRGRLSIIDDNGHIKVVPELTEDTQRDLLQEVYRDGVVKKVWTFDEVLANHQAYAERFPILGAA